MISRECCSWEEDAGQSKIVHLVLGMLFSDGGPSRMPTSDAVGGACRSVEAVPGWR